MYLLFLFACKIYECTSLIEKSEIGCGICCGNTKLTEIVQFEYIRISLHMKCSTESVIYRR